MIEIIFHVAVAALLLVAAGLMCAGWTPAWPSRAALLRLILRLAERLLDRESQTAHADFLAAWRVRPAERLLAKRYYNTWLALTHLRDARKLVEDR